MSAVEMPRCGWPWKTLGSQERDGKLALTFLHRHPQRLEIANGAIPTFPQRQRLSLFPPKMAKKNG
jgi:hypothetical protein